MRATVMSLKEMKIKVKNRGTRFYSLLYYLYEKWRGFNVRYPKYIAGALYSERQIRLLCWSNFKRIFYYEPMFRSICSSVGKRLHLIDGIPYISQGLELNVGDNCTIYGVTNFELIDIRNKGVLNIGDSTSIGYGSIISVASRIDIGSYVLIATDVKIRDNDGHPIEHLRRRNNEGMDQEAIKPVIIEDDVWIGSSSIINKGVRIGQGAVIGAGSVVTKDIPPFSVAAGNPARVIKYLNSPDIESE